ncbi:MAG: hypothetical protein KGI28_06430 [Thaumarchaeota archaeon]|nr:hypothetical protein [Nitrososphaerota archaeon]
MKIRLSSIIIIFVIINIIFISTDKIISFSAFGDTSVESKSSSQLGILQADRNEYDVSYINGTTVKLNGTIANFNPADTKVTIGFVLPDGSMKGSEISADSNGNYATTYYVDSNSQKGDYTVFVSYASTIFGKISFTVKQIPVHMSLTEHKIPLNFTKPNLTYTNITKIKQPFSATTNIPSWIKNNAKWWSEGTIGDSDFLKGVEYLAQNKIITVPPVNVTSSNSQIPSWIKNNAKWWSEGTIGDSDFLKGVEYLAQNGIILIHKTTQITTQPITKTIIQPVNSTQALFPQQTELGDGWIIGNLTLSTEQGGEWLEDWYQSYTNNYDNKKIHVEIAKYESSDKSQQTVNHAVSMNMQMGAIAITPDDSIKGYCWITDMHMGSTNGQLSTMFFCQKDEYAILENPFAYDNGDQVKQDMTKLAQIILNKLPNQASGQSQSNTISQPQNPSQSDLVQLFPTYNDGLTWSMSKEKDMSYNNGNETVDAYQREYVKSQDMGSGVIDVSIYRFGSNDEAKQRTDGFFSNAQSQTKVGFSTLTGLPNECHGIKEDFGLEERNGVFCNKNNYTIFISGIGNLYNLDDEAINFANMILTKIS